MINRSKKSLQLLTLLLFISSAVVAQNNNDDYLKYSWKKVATQMPDQWYSTADAQRVAETVLFCQQDNGGWQKEQTLSSSNYKTGQQQNHRIKIRCWINH